MCSGLDLAAPNCSVRATRSCMNSELRSLRAEVSDLRDEVETLRSELSKVRRTVADIRLGGFGGRDPIRETSEGSEDSYSVVSEYPASSCAAGVATGVATSGSVVNRAPSPQSSAATPPLCFDLAGARGDSRSDWQLHCQVGGRLAPWPEWP